MNQPGARILRAKGPAPMPAQGNAPGHALQQSPKP
jgi:hypothetical protein